ncbi:hypothetical protein GCM10023217_24910 [Gordonia alkaliphila]|uniref:Uncharacterized protein n=2 Tax=Gordonia alkaliphila TaxID=1053547 RepID=A0ABP8ZCS5_9ACTN
MVQVRAAARAGHLAEFGHDYFGPPAIARADEHRQLLEAARTQLRILDLDPADDAVVVDGVPVTSVARTFIDLCRALPRDDTGIVLGDRLLRDGAIARADLDTELRLLTARDQRAVSALLDRVDPRARTDDESRSRLALQRLGFPTPEVGVDIVDRDGAVVARPSFVWPDYLVAGFCTADDDDDRYLGDVEHERRYAELADIDARLTALGYRVFWWRGDQIAAQHCAACGLRPALLTPRHVSGEYRDLVAYRQRGPAFSGYGRPYDDR